MGLDEVINGRQQFGCVLSHGPGESAVGVQGDFGMQLEFGELRTPKARLIFVHDSCGD